MKASESKKTERVIQREVPGVLVLNLSVIEGHPSDRSDYCSWEKVDHPCLRSVLSFRGKLFQQEVFMRFTAISCIAVLGLATLVSSQTKISGTVQCAKPDEQHMLEVGDRPGHSLMISKGKCTWTKPMEIGGTQTKEDVGTNFDEVRGNKSQGHGYVVGTLANADKIYVRTQGSATLKDGNVDTADGTWSFTGGTGKLKGVKGKGSYKGKSAADGSATYEVEGDYELPK
jgi:hypothetical protein